MRINDNHTTNTIKFAKAGDTMTIGEGEENEAACYEIIIIKHKLSETCTCDACNYIRGLIKYKNEK